METLKNNYLIMAGLITSLFLGGVGGYYTFYKLGPIGNLCELKYISYEEIIALEKQRIESIKYTSDDKNLFFGKNDEVSGIIIELTEIAEHNEDNKVKVVLTSGFIRGNKVKSISSEVHGGIITKLKPDDTGVKQ